MSVDELKQIIAEMQELDIKINNLYRTIAQYKQLEKESNWY